MKWFDATLATPAENLACDEALLDSCEAGQGDEILRFWEPRDPFVVLGYSNQAAREVRLDACRTGNIPVLRRTSGGGTVLQGPGCLNYSLILRIPGSGPLRNITGTNTFIMERQRNALQTLLPRPVAVQGHTDLTVGNLKFSGNAQRRLRGTIIFHGTLLLEFDLSRVEQFLQLPAVQPDYRKNRPHSDFLTNLNVPAEAVKSALREAWGAGPPLTTIPAEQIENLVRNKYSRDEWNLKF